MNMRYFNYIAILLAILMTACNTDDTIIEVNGNNANNQLQIVGRNIPFTDFDVASRTADNDIRMVDFVIFYATTDQDGTPVSECVYYAHSENTIFALDRTSLVDKIGEDKAKNCYMFMVANYPEIYAKICEDAQSTDQNVLQNFVQGKTFDYFLGITSEVTPISGVPEGGLPRFGIFGKTPETPQGTSIDFTQEIPGGTTYEIPMECLFAKMVFNISVDPDQTATDINTENIPNSFKLTGYTIHNLATSIDMNQGTENSTHDNVGVYTNAIVGNMDGVNTDDLHNVSFTFYLPERFFKPVKSATEFAYPFGTGEVKTKDNPTGTIREEDAELRQRYKPLLAKGHTGYNSDYNEASDEKATYVTFTGEFINHQGHSYDVSYDIYVGNDNFGNFDVVRNRQYNNNITIKGIQNAKDQSPNEGAISIDHRVNITRTKPIITNMRLETILDAHFEVRPLRIRAKAGALTNVTVQVLDENGGSTNIPEWIRLENSYGTDNGEPATGQTLYCTTGSAAGKRKYFTYGLVTGEQLDKTTEPNNISANTSVTLSQVDTEGECVWIYVDECTEASTDINAKRSAMIRVTYNGGEPIDYIINQHNLFLVEGEKSYHIEHEEEYLHNFDSEDTFEDNATEDEGMVWGLYNAQLSFDHMALFFDGGNNFFSGILAFIQNIILENVGVNPYYDFYIPKHDTSVSSEAKKRDYRGWVFCNEIITDINANESNRETGYNGTIGALQMDEMPTSAIEYCYNRNKRYANGSIASVDWYIPAIDEMEDIIVNAYSYFDDFHDKYYWSCQPAYMPNYAHFNSLSQNTGKYYEDDKGIYTDNGTTTITHNNGYARATRANYKGDDENDETVDWDYARSGTNGYDNVLVISSTGLFQYKGSFQYKGTYRSSIKLEEWATPGMESIEREEGNFERNTKHRVRCVRKSDNTNTSPN